MKVETKEIYKCGYCNKLYQIKHACANHEKSCWGNPDNSRRCIGCEFLNKKTTEMYYDLPTGDESSRHLSLLHCSKIDSFMYPPKVEHKDNSWDIGELNQPMKKECDQYEPEKYRI